MNIFTLPVKPARFLLVLFLLLLSAGLLATYDLFLQESNEYMGYRTIDLNFAYLVGLVVSVTFASILIPVKIAKPSDFLLLFYGILIILPYGVLHPILRQVTTAEFLSNMGILLLPAVFVKLITNKVRPINLPRLVSSGKIINGITVAAVCVAIYAVLNAPGASGFDILSSYVRRLEAREIFTAGSFGAYASSITLNGLLPIIAYFSGLEGRRSLAVISLLCAIVFFYTLGVKAHFLMIGLGYLLGRNMRLNQLSRMQRQINLILVFIFVTFFVEYVFSGYSYVADYLVRRLFSVPAFVISAYFDLIADPSQAWSFLAGVDYPRGVTYLVGERYLNDAEANANTNTFVYQLAAGGVPMFIATIMLVALIFLLLDSVYAAKKNRVFMYLGFIYAILLIEQNATTALLSSGVGLLLMVFSISAESSRNKVIGHIAK